MTMTAQRRKIRTYGKPSTGKPATWPAAWRGIVAASAASPPDEPAAAPEHKCNRCDSCATRTVTNYFTMTPEKVCDVCADKLLKSHQHREPASLATGKHIGITHNLGIDAGDIRDYELRLDAQEKLAEAIEAICNYTNGNKKRIAEALDWLRYELSGTDLETILADEDDEEESKEDKEASN